MVSTLSLPADESKICAQANAGASSNTARQPNIFFTRVMLEQTPLAGEWFQRGSPESELADDAQARLVARAAVRQR
jgi:hypothetical protein